MNNCGRPFYFQSFIFSQSIINESSGPVFLDKLGVISLRLLQITLILDIKFESVFGGGHVRGSVSRVDQSFLVV